MAVSLNVWLRTATGSAVASIERVVGHGADGGREVEVVARGAERDADVLAGAEALVDEAAEVRAVGAGDGQAVRRDRQVAEERSATRRGRRWPGRSAIVTATPLIDFTSTMPSVRIATSTGPPGFFVRRIE